jgi:hypothetical protein
MTKKPARKRLETSRAPSGGGFYGYRRRRSKTDWAGIGLGDAFKSNLDYFLRMPAQRLFYLACRKIQEAAAALAGISVETGLRPKVKPQLGPCYTSYPVTLAAYSAIGLTGFLEFEASTSQNVLHAHLEAYLTNPAAAEHVNVDPETFQKVARNVVRTVQTRLFLEDLARSPRMSVVELYRLFCASQQNLRFSSLPEIINAVVIYGDILPDWKEQNLHPVTLVLLTELQAVSQPFFDQLAATPPQGLVNVGVAWVRAICACLAPHLPPPKSPAEKEAGEKGGARKRPRTDAVAPLNGPHPPALFGPRTGTENAVLSLLSGLSEGDEDDSDELGDDSEDAQAIQQTLSFFRAAIDGAGGQQSRWEDMRSDLVERTLMASGFQESPIQGNPTDGHEVKVDLGGEEEAGGEIHDRPVELSEDLFAYDKLIRESQPIADALRRALYPNVEELPETDRFRTTGSLDPGRLALADFSSVIFKRNRIRERADRRGRPVLLIACDGSGSLSDNQMRMLKVLAAAWLSSTARIGVQILAGLYHSGTIRQGISGPLVQWIYHPRKTPTTSRKEAARAVVSLPDTGTGVQSDALSLAFMLDEARQVARAGCLYLILITDCAWNRSFNTEKEGKEEVYSLLQAAYEESGNKLHVTLVALGVNEETGFEGLVDKCIRVSQDNLVNYSSIAEQIGVYVASCMKERRKVVSGR